MRQRERQKAEQARDKQPRETENTMTTVTARLRMKVPITGLPWPTTLLSFLLQLDKLLYVVTCLLERANRTVFCTDYWRFQ